MQPGDNFAIAASLDGVYRDGIRVDTNAGTNLLDAAGQTIPISGQTNPAGIRGIRTNMLTVWRRLHIEVDSMGQAQENYVRGNVIDAFSLDRLRTKTIPVQTNPLEVDRFENGRMEFAFATAHFLVVSNTANTVTVKNFTTSDMVVPNNVNFYMTSSFDGARSALGTVPTGATIAPMQTATLNVVTTVPLEPKLFENGSMYITPNLKSLTIVSNTANEVTLKNTGASKIIVAASTGFRLYDDDDFNDNDGPFPGDGSLDGDEGEDIPEPNMELLQANDVACILDSEGKVSNECNALLPAYVRRETNFLPGSHENIPFDANVTEAEIDKIFVDHFNNGASESSSDFWTVYLLGAYQFIKPTTSSLEDWDGDPDLKLNPNRGNSFAFGQVDNLNGKGAVIYTELNRSTEYKNIDVLNSFLNPSILSWEMRPIGAKYTTVHEIGHLFFGEHSIAVNSVDVPDAGLMAQPDFRIKGIFSDETIHRIRGGSFTDIKGVIRTVIHP